MPIRQRTLLYISLLLFSLVAVALLFTWLVLYLNILKHDNWHMLGEISEIKAILAEDSEGIRRTARNWSFWDDTYAFVQNGDLEYLSSNITPSVMESLALNLIGYVNNQGEIIYSASFLSVHDGLAPTPVGFLKEIESGRLLVHELDETHNGFVLFPEAVVMVSAYPVGRQGTVSVCIQKDASSRIDLVVADDEVGLPDGFDLTSSNSLGLQLVKVLVNQMEGSLNIVNDQGTRFEATLFVGADSL